MNDSVRAARAKRLVAALKEAYPVVKSELAFETPFQFLVAVMLSAQCTDKKVNAVTRRVFERYRTAADFAAIPASELAHEIASITYFNAKAKHIVAAAKKIVAEHGGQVPQTEAQLVALPGVGYKTAHVVLGELYGQWEGIPTDTHVKRFAYRFDLSDAHDLTRISKDLEALVPKEDWKYVNNGFVLYGRYTCPARPHDCSEHLLTKIWPPAGSRWPSGR